MIASLGSAQFPTLAIHNKKQHNSSPPYSDVLKTDLVSKFNSPFELKQVHSLLIKNGNPDSILPLQKIACICALTTSFNYARQIIQRVEQSEMFVWNSCLRSLAEGDHPMDTIHLLYRLREADLLPDTFTCSFVIKACSNLSARSEGKVIHGLVEKLGFQDDHFLQNTIINMYACCGIMEDARTMFDKMPLKDVVSWNIMITQLTKRSDIQVAQNLFDQMPQKSVTSWTAMIAGYVQWKRPHEAINLFYQMEESGAKPNEVTVVAVLAACADLGALDLGKRVHEFSNQCGFGKNVRICNTLIDMYVKCGCVEIAQEVFNKMDERTVVSWSAMIGGLAVHGRGDEALKLFSRMNQIGIHPNGVTFLGLLHACSHMGLLDEGRKFFTSMTRDYGIIPQIEHYGCMVDLLSRAGLLLEARELINNMPLKPNSIIWGAFLGGCRLHKNLEMGEEAIHHLLELDPENDGYYVVLSNIYAEKGRWDDVARVRKLMRDNGIKKTPGLSAISIGGEVHEFVAGDGDHPYVDDIQKKWETLLEQLKLRGYLPDTSAVLLDTEEHEKEPVLYRHSEKLAVTFGLLKTPPGTVLRIIKNLRVCSDCHNALKLISKITNRKIIVRDRNRFHCFEDGSCSCKDYW